jgi:hypothetical protein
MSTNVRLAPMLRMSGAVTPSPHIRLSRVVQKGNLLFTNRQILQIAPN